MTLANVNPYRALLACWLVAAWCAVASAQVQVPTDNLIYYYKFEGNLNDAFGANDLAGAGRLK